MKYVSENWFWIAIGLALTRVFIGIAHIERGYTAYGGEWLVLPLVLMLVEVARDIGDFIKELFETGGGYGSDED